MDKKRSLLNVFTAIFFKVVIIILVLFAKRSLIHVIGNDANGLNSLYLSILGFLSVAELGIGTAISFSMYGPIVRGEKEKIASIFHLFEKIYLVIGGVIFISGVALMPALPFLAKGYSSQNLYSTFFIMLVSTVLGYLFSAKISLINAYKNNYITTTLGSFAQILKNVLQIVGLYIFKSFAVYLSCRVIATIFEWVCVELYFRKNYKEIADIRTKVDKETKQDITKNVKAMFMHKIGGVLINTIDSIVISAFLGVALLGKYSNYTMVMTSMTSLITLFFTPLTSVVGHLCAQENVEQQQKYFRFVYQINFIIGLVFFLGYYAVIDSVVALFFGQNLLLAKSVSFIITLNYFIQFMRQTVMLFRDATGTFFYDRFRPLLEGIINVVLSIAFVNMFGVIGVLVATILTNLFISHIVEPYFLHKKTFNTTPQKYYVINYTSIIIFSALLVILQFLMRSFSNPWATLLVNGFIAVGLAAVPIAVILIFNKSFRQNLKKIFSFKKRKNRT